MKSPSVNERGRSWFPPAAAPSTCPVLFIEPADKNGLVRVRHRSNADISLRHAAGNGHRAAGRRRLHADGTATLRIRLLLVVVPAKNDVAAFGNSAPPINPEADGFVFGLFDVGAIVESALRSPSPVGIDVSVIAPSTAGGERCVYTRPSLVCAAGKAPATAERTHGDLRFSR